MTRTSIAADRLASRATFAVIPSWVIRAGSSRAVHLYAVLADMAGRDGAAWPSRRTLADAIGVSVDTVDRAVTELVDLGALSVEPQTHDGRQTSNLYLLNHTPPPASPPAVDDDPPAVDDDPPAVDDDQGGGRTHAEGGAAPVRHPEQEPLNYPPKAPPRPAAEQGRPGRRRRATAPPGPPPPPPWCGGCDQRTRLRETPRGLERCPTCHPLTTTHPHERT